MDKGKSRRTLIQILWLFVMAYGLINVWRVCDKITVMLTGELIETVALEDASTRFSRGDNEYSAPVIIDDEVQNVFEGVSYSTKRGDIIRLYRDGKTLVSANYEWYKDGHIITNIILVGVLTAFSMQTKIEDKKRMMDNA